MPKFEQFPQGNKKEEKSNIMKKIRESTSSRNKMLSALAGYGISFGIGNHESTAKEVFPSHEIEVAETTNEVSSSERTISYKEAQRLSENPNTEKGEEEISLESYTIKLDSYFELGKAIVSQEEKSLLASHIVKEMESWPKDVQERLISGELFVKVSAGCSPEEIKGSIDVGDGTFVSNNRDLSIQRMERGVEIAKKAQEALGIAFAVQTAKPFENGINPDRPERYVEISVEANASGFADVRIFEGIHGVVEKIYVDASASMEGKVTELYGALDAVGLLNKQTKIQFGSAYNELSEEYTIASKEGAEIYDRSVRQKRRFSSKEDTFTNALLVLEKFPLVSQEQKETSEKNTIAFITDEYLKVTEQELQRLKLQMQVRNKDVVFFMQNRETKEVKKITVEDIFELYNSNDKNGEELTLDVNQKKIEGGRNIDILI